MRPGNFQLITMKHIGLFEGIGGFSLAAKWMGWETVAWCEWIDHKQDTLKKHFPNAKQHGDIQFTDFNVYRGQCDVLTGGFPCQDASIAKQDGNGQQGIQGERTGLIWHMLRAIREVKPKYVVSENVANILKTNNGRDFRTILSQLAGMGYNAEWRVCRASEVGAPHHRARLYLVAYSSSIRLQEGETFFSYVSEEIAPLPWSTSGTTVQIARAGAWESQPPVLCLDDGLPYQLDVMKIHGYGNAVVPEIPYRIFKAIQEYENTTHPA